MFFFLSTYASEWHIYLMYDSRRIYRSHYERWLRLWFRCYRSVYSKISINDIGLTLLNYRYTLRGNAIFIGWFKVVQYPSSIVGGVEVKPKIQYLHVLG